MPRHPEGATIPHFSDAYHAEPSRPIIAFRQKFGVDYLVANERAFAAGYLAEGMFFCAPYDEAIVEMVAGRSDFGLRQVPLDRKLVQSGDLFLIPCAAHVFQ